MTSKSDLTAELRTHLRGLRVDTATAEHPSPEVLTRYQADELPEQRDDEIREHLASCPDCAALVLELTALHEGEDPGGFEASEFEVAAAWKRQRQHLRVESEPTPPARRPASAAHRAWAAAAVLAALTVGLSFWGISQNRRIAELQRPQVNPPLVNLTPLGSVRQAGKEPPLVRFAAGSSRAWLILNPEEPLAFSLYQVSFFAPEGDVAALTLEDVKASEANNFRIELPRGLLPSGDYRVFLSGRRQGRLELVETYSVRLSAD